jgi:tRNA-splicing ligase RtcB
MPVLKVLSGERVPIKIWSKDVEEAAASQLRNTGNLPFVFKWVAVMPDVHAGKGSTIGSVIATKGAIVPACVGVDLGCGMQAVRTSLRPDQLESKLPALRSRIERAVPTGAASHADDRHLDMLGESDTTLLVEGARNIESRCNLDGQSDKVLRGIDKFPTQLGTLGSGNHFIEVCVSKKDEVWVVLHSGSRGVGNLIAQHHINVARGLMKKMFIELPDLDLSYLVQETPEYDAYMNDMLWAQEFARLNRLVMMQSILAEMRLMWPFDTSPAIDCHHNYVSHENHFGENVLVTRKGAVRARRGDLGIIPGSMGAKSYIVRGLGNEEAFQSCSHGAGRRMSRTQARKSFSAADLVRETKGVECRKDEAVLDEIPSAYKDIDEVMDNQNDLVEAVEELKQVLCVKGT